MPLQIRINYTRTVSLEFIKAYRPVIAYPREVLRVQYDCCSDTRLPSENLQHGRLCKVRALFLYCFVLSCLPEPVMLLQDDNHVVKSLI